MGTKLTLPVEVEWKAGAATADYGELEGYASVFGTVDLEGDVVMPGAFRKTINDWNRATQPLPLIADHELSTSGLIGSVHHLAEVAKPKAGLKFKARFGPTQKAQDVRANVLAGHLRGASFTYEPIASRPGSGSIGGKAVRRFLDELRLFEVTVSPFPIHPETDLAAKAVSDAAWDGAEGRFTPEQYRRSCLIDTGQGEPDAKGRYRLPVTEPDGAVNRHAVHAAAAQLANLDTDDDTKRKAARRLIRLYGDLGEDPPDSVRHLAGAMSAAQTDWTDSMQKALAIPHEYARKAAVDALIADYPVVDLTEVTAAAGEDAPGTAPGAAGNGTPPPELVPAAYALTFLNQGPADGPPDGGPPPEAPPAILATIERDASVQEADSLEATINQALGGNPS
jgi:HK97 family phage prohead protease